MAESGKPKQIRSKSTDQGTTLLLNRVSSPDLENEKFESRAAPNYGKKTKITKANSIAVMSSDQSGVIAPPTATNHQGVCF